MDEQLAAVTQAMQERRFEDVGPMLDEVELQEPSALSTEQWPHAVHLLAHVYAGRLEDARFVFKRTPEAVRAAKPELQAAFALLQRLWVKDYQHIWTALQFGWSQDAQPLVEALAGQLRQRMLDLVQRAYASIGVPKLAVLLGCSQEDAAAAAASRGWPVADGLADVKQPEQPAGSSEAAALRSLERLTEFVVHLGS